MDTSLTIFSSFPLNQYNIISWKQLYNENGQEGCPHGVKVKALDCRIIVREFKLVHFRTNTFGKGMNLPLILPSMG